MIHHLIRDIGWPVLVLGALIVLAAWRPVLAWARFERELFARARRMRARARMVDLTPDRKVP